MRKNTFREMKRVALNPLTEAEFNELLKLQGQLDLVKGGSRNDISVFKIYRKNRRGGSFWSVLKL